MAQFTIDKQDLTGLSGQVVVITGGSSGIGLATASLLLECGASVIVGDQNPIPEALLSQYGGQRLKYIPTDVAVWASLLNLFKAAVAQYEKIDHVFVAAGIVGFRANYLGEVIDSEGELQEPSIDTFNINLRAAINTAYLGMHHIRHQSPQEGSIVLTGSASSFLRYRNAEYTVAKHGVLGFMRGLVPALTDHPGSIRINCVSPSWTRTGMFRPESFEKAGYGDQLQDAEVVARSAVLLISDKTRQGQNIFSQQGKFWEVEGVFMKVAQDFMSVDEDTVLKAVLKLRAEEMALESAKRAEEEKAKMAKEAQT